MLELLIISEIWASISYRSIVAPLFSTVARFYDVLLKLIHDTESLNTYSFDDLATIMYTVAGVFMLFRVIIGLINMLINPDTVNDKSVGASKMVTRIVTCLIMLIVFVPNGLLFGDTGLFSRLEKALLAEDGIITKIMGTTVSYENDDSNKNILIDNVDAADGLNCYYYRYLNETTAKGEVVSVHKITFYDKPSWEGGGTTNIIAKGILKETYFSYTESTAKMGGNGTNYTKLGHQLGGFTSIPKKCPGSFVYDGSKQAWVVADSVIAKTAGSYYLEGGQSSYKDFLDAYTKKVTELKQSGRTLDSKVDELKEANPYSEKSYLAKVEPQAVTFSQEVLTSFFECQGGSEYCLSGLDILKDTSADDEVVDMIKDDQVHLDFLAAVIIGLGLVIYLAILCVDVIIRRFKLLLLQMIAPVAIISYADPKDKIFGQWFKMYINIYVDLFVKLIAISLAVNILQVIFDNSALYDNMLLKLFYIIAALLFAKLAPSLVSKVFGLELGSSFKDIGKMLKTGAGLAAGAAIGGAVGAVTGFGGMSPSGIGSGILGAGKGIIQGAGSGMKGKLTGGARSVAQSNATVRKQKADGLNFMDRVGIGLANATGMGMIAGQKATEKMEFVNDVDKKQGELKDYAVGEIKKKGSALNVGTITGHSGNVLVRDTEKNINMQKEYATQSTLASTSAADWDAMDINARVREYGLAGYQDSLVDAQVFQNERVAELENHAVAAFINNNRDDNDVKGKIAELQSAQDMAIRSGVSEFEGTRVPDAGSFNEKTLKKVKDTAKEANAKIKEEHGAAMKKAKYINNK